MVMVEVVKVVGEVTAVISKSKHTQAHTHKHSDSR